MQDFSKTLLQAGKDGEFDINDTDSIIKYIMYKLYPDFYNGSEEFNMDITDDVINSRYEYIKSKAKEYKIKEFVDYWKELRWKTVTRTNKREIKSYFPPLLFPGNRKWMRDSLRLDFMRYINVKYILYSGIDNLDPVSIINGKLDKVSENNIYHFIRHSYDWDGEIYFYSKV